MAKKKGINNHFTRFLNRIECIENALPYTACLFCLFALFVLVLPLIGFLFDWTVLHLANHEMFHVENLIPLNGLHRIILAFVNNYTSFALPGIVIVGMIGIGIPESSGLIRSAIKLVIQKSLVNVTLLRAGFFALSIACFQKYELKAGRGTLISSKLPSAVLFFVFWPLFLIAWVYPGIPLVLCPGVHYDLPL